MNKITDIKNNSTDKYIGIKELQELLGIGKTTAYKVTKEIKHYKIGTCIRFKLSDVEQWLECKCGVEPQQPKYRY